MCKMIYALTIITCMGLLVIAAIEIAHPTADSNLQIIVTIVGFLTPTIGIILNIVKSNENAMTITDVKTVVDQRAKELLGEAKKLGTIEDRTKTLADNILDVKTKLVDTVAEKTSNTENKIDALVTKVDENTAITKDVQKLVKNGH